MRILITAISFCEYVIQQANALTGRGHDVMLFLPQNLVDSTVGNYFTRLIDPKVQALLYRGNHRPSRLYDIFCKRLFKAMRNFCPDVIHIHCNAEIETLLIVLNFRKIPLIVTIHDVVSHSGIDSKHSLRMKIISKYLKYHSKKIHVHGEILKNELIQLHSAYAKKTVVIPHGTLALFTYWDDDNTKREPHTCLFFGRMERYRGLDNLVKIGNILKNVIPDIKIIVAGRGSELIKYKKSLLESGIFEIHDAYIPDQDVHVFFRRASLLLLPYHDASQSGIIHMGLAFGVPMVATAVGEIPRTINDGVDGRIIPCNDVTGFANAVASLLQDKMMLESMRKACLEKGNQLAFSNIVKNYEILYYQAIKHL